MKKWLAGMVALSLALSLISCKKVDHGNESSASVQESISSDQSFLSEDEMLDDSSTSTGSSRSNGSSTSRAKPILKTESENDGSAAPTIGGMDEFSSLENTKKGWGPGTNFDKQNRPGSCVDFQKKYGKYDALFMNQDALAEMHLTFDEGYENGYTAKILDVLKEKNVPAVFFVTMPYVKKNPDLVERMISEGHVVGNHTVTHPSMPTVSIEKAKQEIMDLHHYVKEKFNYTMTLFRPPMGEYSERTLAIAQSLGYKTVFWSFAYPDWKTDAQPEPAPSLKKMVDRTHNGAIYLLHAVSKTNTEILGSFIDQVREKGFVFETLS